MGLPPNSKCRPYLLFKFFILFIYFGHFKDLFSSFTLHSNLSVHMSNHFGFNGLFNAAIGSGVQLPTETMAPNSNTRA